MPESCKDRPTKSHEYLFLLSKSAKYYYDADAIKEDSTYGSGCGWKNAGHEIAKKTKDVSNPAFRFINSKRNKRSVWTIPAGPTPEAHFATYPKKLVEPCILAGCPKDGTVLDPFLGSGTTALVAYKHNRRFIGIEISKIYLDDIAIPRINKATKQLKMFSI